MARLSALPLAAAAALCVLASAETCFSATPAALPSISRYYCPAQKPSSWPSVVTETFAVYPPVAAYISRTFSATESEAAAETRPDVEEIPAETDALPELVDTLAEAGSEMARVGSEMARAILTFASLGLSVGQIVAARAAERAVEKMKTARLPTAAEIQAVAPSADDVAEVVKQEWARIPERDFFVERVRWVGERVEGTARESFRCLEGVVREKVGVVEGVVRGMPERDFFVERVRWVGERVEGTARDSFRGLEGVVREKMSVVEGVVKESATKARGEAEIAAAVGKVKALEALEVLRVQSVLAKEVAAVGIENAKDFAGVVSEVAARGLSVGALRSEELLLFASDSARDAQREWVSHVFPALAELSRIGAYGLSFTAVRAMMTAMKMGQKMLGFLLTVFRAFVVAFSRAAIIANTGLYVVAFGCGAACLYQIYNFLSTVWSICSNGRSLFSSLRLAWRFISRNVNRAAVAFGNSMCRTPLSSDSTRPAPRAPSAPFCDASSSAPFCDTSSSAPFCDTSSATPATPAPPTNHCRSIDLVTPLTTLTPAGSARRPISPPTVSEAKAVPSTKTTSLSSDSASSASRALSAPFCDTLPAAPATLVPPTNHRKSINLVTPLTRLTPAGSTHRPIPIPTPFKAEAVPSTSGGEPVRIVRRRRALGTEEAERGGASAVSMRYNLHYSTNPSGDAVEGCAPSGAAKPRPTPGAPSRLPKVTRSSRVRRPRSREYVVETIDLSSP